MTLWILNHVPSWVLALTMIIGLPLVSVVGCIFMRARMPSLADGDNNEVAGVVLSVLGGIYGIVLAFVIVVLWEQFQGAQSIVSEETTALSEIVRDSQAFSTEASVPLVKAVREYSHAVVDDEWPRMADGGESARASRAVSDMYRALQGYEPASESAKAFYGEVSAKLDDVVASRRQRLRQSQYGLPGVLKALLAAGALMIVGFLYLFGTKDQRVHLVMTGSVATLLAFNLLLATMLEHPFSGDVAVKSAVFRQGELAPLWAPPSTTLP